MRPTSSAFHGNIARIIPGTLRTTRLLRTTDLSLEAISRQVGYEHANTLRVLLRERRGETTRSLRGRTAAGSAPPAGRR